MSNLIPNRYRPSVRLGNPLSMLRDDFLRPFFYGEAPTAFRVDVRDEGEVYVMEAELPGVERENIRIDVDDGILTISAEWKSVDQGGKSGDYVVNERRAGRVQRAFSLDNVIEDEIVADYSDGVLRLTMPKREEVRRTPRRIELN
jgi:HSP20 family protein